MKFTKEAQENRARANKINTMLYRKTAEQMGLEPHQVHKIIKQFHDAIMRILERKFDFENMTYEDYKNARRDGFYVPGLGKFILNWKYIEAWQKKYKKDNVED